MQKIADYFAGQALAGTAENPYDPTQIAHRAWAISDAMMLQRGARKKLLCDCPVNNEEGKKDG